MAQRSVEPLRILVVCTANICRSPAVEAFVRRSATAIGADLTVSSAGFLFEDRPASTVVGQEMANRGIDLAEHRSRIATADVVAAADLVVTMERRHGRDLAQLGGAEKSFTLVSAADRLEGIDPELQDPRQRLGALVATWQTADLLGQGPDHIEDPYGRSLRANRKMVEQVEGLAKRLVDGLFPASALAR